MNANFVILKRNISDQVIPIFAWDTSTGAPKTGDSSNITAYISKDGGSPVATSTTHPIEIGATDMPGIYVFPLTATETDCNLLVLVARSTTTNVQIRPVYASTLLSAFAWIRRS